MNPIAPQGKYKRDTAFCAVPQIRYNGGVGEIRTLAPVAQPNDLANRPLQPLEYHSVKTLKCNIFSSTKRIITIYFPCVKPLQVFNLKNYLWLITIHGKNFEISWAIDDTLEINCVPETCHNALAKAVPEIMNIPQRKYTSNQYPNVLIVMCLSINLTYILLKICLDIWVQ